MSQQKPDLLEVLDMAEGSITITINTRIMIIGELSWLDGN